MLILLAAMLASSPTVQYSPNLHVQSCERSLTAYSNWAIDARNTLDRNSTDMNGPVDQSLIMDANWAFDEALFFVRTNIQYEQRAASRYMEPRAFVCRDIVFMAERKMAQYVKTLISGNISANDRVGRRALRDRFREDLRGMTTRFQTDRLPESKLTSR